MRCGVGRGTLGRPAAGRALFWHRASTSRAPMRPCGPGRQLAKINPACAASRRANGVTVVPPASFAGPKLRSGVRTSRNGSSLIGCWAGARKPAGAGAGVMPAATCYASRRGRGAVDAAVALPRIATTAPTGAMSPSGTRISVSTPAASPAPPSRSCQSRSRTGYRPA